MLKRLLLIVVCLVLLSGVASAQDEGSPRFCDSLIAFVAQSEPDTG